MAVGKPKSSAAAQARQAGRRAARMSAVQALYQWEMAKMPAREVVAEFITHHLTPDCDRSLFGTLVTGVEADLPSVDHMVQGALSETFDFNRLEAVLRQILRAAVFELAHQSDPPARVVISEYVALTLAFFTPVESGLVNGVLDKLARVVRPAEFA